MMKFSLNDVIVLSILVLLNENKFDVFLMTTQQREIESQRKKEPQIPGQSNILDCKSFRKYQLNKIQIGCAEYTVLTYNFWDLTKTHAHVCHKLYE